MSTASTVQLPATKKERIDLLKRRIEESGLSTTAFAERIMLRDARTVRRWLAGDSPIPNQVLSWLVEAWKIPWPRRGAKGGRSS
jgi:transcriptional regulator with XRE-family HTH domain